MILLSPEEPRTAAWLRVWVKALLGSTLPVMNLADDVLQLNLNAESKETRARRKCPVSRRSVTDRSRPVMPQLEPGGDRGAAMMERETAA